MHSDRLQAALNAKQQQLSEMRPFLCAGFVNACESSVEAHHIGIQVAIVIRWPQEGVDCARGTAHAST